MSAVTRVMKSEVDSFTVIRGYHVYEEVWSSVIGEVLVCRRDTRNRHDPFAVATCKGTTVVGHVPRRISAICGWMLKVPDLTKALWDQARRQQYLPF